MSHYHTPSSTSCNNVPSAVRLASIGRIFSILVFLLSLVGGSAASVQATTITFTAEELLGKPTNTSITINIVPASDVEYYYEYDVISGAPYDFRTANVTAAGGQPSEVTITDLIPNTRYYYRMVYDGDGDVDDGDFETRGEHSFWTQRAKGSTFKFTVTSDSHATFNTNHQQAMTNILNDQPDFDLDLGDTFYPASGTTTQAAVNNAYLAYRDPLYMDRIGHSVPIFLASGNHEEEEGWNLDDTPFSIGVGSIQARKAYFPTPTNDGFYSANTDSLARIDETIYGDELREDYYAWEWGDALFVVIDEFQYTMNLPYTPAAGEGSDDTKSGDQWNWTLGQQQYNWLKQTLENSNAKYKFVFSHNMVGGIPKGPIAGAEAGYVRGGAEAAGYFEWGGKNASGTDEFATKRPGWDMTIHEMFMAYGVSAYFHGHDHQYVYETRDSIVYQEVPSPSMAGSGFSGIYTEGDYGTYQTIKMLPSTGHLRVTVAPAQATVEYVRSNGGDSYTYTIAPNTPAVTHDLTMAVNPGGAGTTTPAVGPHSYTENTVVNITATPALGYAFSSWTGGVADPNSASTTITVDADKTVTANFTSVPTYVLTTSVSPEGAGTISPAAGNHPYNQGTAVAITATANSGYVFDHWGGDCSGTGTCSVTMSSNKSVTANFTPVTTITFTGAELLGRPTDTSISISVVPDAAISLYYEYGTAPGAYTGQTATTTAAAGQPKVVEIGCLAANTRYYYRMQYSADGGASWVARPARSFQTQRAAGSTFTFDVTSDSHVNIQLGSPSNWTSTMNGVASNAPDFLIDLGDTFAMDNGSTSVPLGDTAAADQKYKDQLPFFNIASAASAIYIVPGNHEQQEAWHLQGTLANSLPVMGKNAEKKYFLNPVPDAFYTGDATTHPNLSGDQLKQDYYAWTWGDALFVVISPFWTTTTKPYTTSTGGGETDTTGSGNRWDWTLGQTQFNWLQTTLQNSTAKYKFVFAHQIVGGNSMTNQVNYGHGGVDSANFVEWGGYNTDGTTYTWSSNRSGWGSLPIRQMMEANHVTAFFHGHDHQMAYESLNGMVYQAVPSGSFTGSFGNYTTGGNSGNTIWADSTQGPGHLKVTVSPTQTTVDFIRYNASSAAYSYTMQPRGHLTVDGAVSSATGAANASSLSFSHTTGTGANRLLLVGVSWNSGSIARTISSVTFTPSGGSAVTLTPVITQQAGTQLRYSAIYRWPAGTALPSGQTGTVVVTFNGSVSNGIVAGAANFAGVNQTTPLGTPGGAPTSSTSSTTPSVTLTGLNGNELVFDNVFMGATSSSQTLTAGAGQTQRWNAYVSSVRAAASTEQATGSSVTMSWTAASAAYWAIAAVPINPVPAYDLTVAVDGDGTTSPAVGVHTYTPGSIVPVTATPGTGYVLDHWSGACSGSGACSVTMDADKTVTAHFTVSVDVAITKPGSYPVLDWAHQAAAVDHYAVYRSLTAPYFTASAASKLTDVPTSTPTHTDSTAVLTVAGNRYFYLVGPVNGCGGACGRSNRTGAFVFGLVPGN
jgi:phosphodiesterase/alkaline phosphatase D-like protein